MFALVESGTITQFPNGNKGITIGDNQYPQSIYTLWTEAERNAIGIYTVEIDETNKKNQEFYINTGITYSFGSNKVTGVYGTATAKQLNDVLYTQSEVDADTYQAPHAKEGERISGATWVANDVKSTGLKTYYKKVFNQQASHFLAKTDWSALSDNTMSSDWIAKRKSWRDIPQDYSEDKYDELLAKDELGNLTHTVWSKP